MNKKFVILFFVIVMVIASFITVKLPPKEDKTVKNELSLEEAKEKLLLTKKIRVGQIPLWPGHFILCSDIREEEVIQEIIKILNESHIPSDEWATLERTVDYYLEFLDEENKMFATVQTQSSLPLKFKGKGYTYQIDLDDGEYFKEILKNHCENQSSAD